MTNICQHCGGTGFEPWKKPWNKQCPHGGTSGYSFAPTPCRKCKGRVGDGEEKPYSGLEAAEYSERQ